MRTGTELQRDGFMRYLNNLSSVAETVSAAVQSRGTDASLVDVSVVIDAAMRREMIEGAEDGAESEVEDVSGTCSNLTQSHSLSHSLTHS